MAVTKTPVSYVKVDEGIVVCILEDGSICTFMQESRFGGSTFNSRLKSEEKGYKELIPLYEGDNSLGKLINVDPNNKFTCI